MPTGRLRKGYSRVAGVVRVEVMEELERLRRERNIPTMSQSLGDALDEWLRLRRSGVLNPGSRATLDGTSPTQSGVLNPPSVEGRTDSLDTSTTTGRQESRRQGES